MKIRISEEQGSWRHEGRVWYFGDYDVPRDMDIDTAKAAVAAGAAVEVKVVPPPTKSGAKG